MSALSQQQVEQFQEQGYLKVEGVLDPATYLDPVIDEYAGVLDSLAKELFAGGEISSTYDELPFGERVTRIYAESGRAHSQYFDFSLPFTDVREDTPFWCGTGGAERLYRGAAAGRGGIADRPGDLLQPGAARAHQAAGEQAAPDSQRQAGDRRHPVASGPRVVTPEADETNMLTVWFSLYDTPVEAGPLKIVPRSHQGGLRITATNRAVRFPRNCSTSTPRPPSPPHAATWCVCTGRRCTVRWPTSATRSRWSFDLRYNPIGQHTGREAFPGFIARSRKAPYWNCARPASGARAGRRPGRRWLASTRGGQTDVPFGRWADGHPDCA